ncbi:hypothetical protein BGW39_002312 [Mortierella sp. 14UC]|nr:hypothetical protein BGW39_002312 [Mortierella sp. 14UC]
MGTHVFHIPELVANICSFLHKKDVSPLMRTCRRLYILCSFVFYKDIDMQAHADKSLSTSFDATRALLRNSVLVRTIKMDRRFSRIYLGGIWTRCQETGDPAITFFDWYLVAGGDRQDDAYADADTKSTTSFPVMTNLRQLHCIASLEQASSASDPIYDADTGISRLYMLIDLNIHLSDLCLHALQITFGPQLYRLARTLSGIKALGSLSLHIQAYGKHTDKIVPAIFFACPQSVHTLDMDLSRSSRSSGSLTMTTMTTTDSGMDEMIEGDLLPRQDPLLNLACWNVKSKVPYNFDTLQSMLSHCPNVNKLEVPRLINTNDADIVARFIIDSCPRLTALSQQYSFSDVTGLLMAAISRVLPENTLKSVEFSGLDDPDDTLLFSLWPHFGSLSSIELLSCVEASSEVLQVLLCHCSALEALVVTSNEDSGPGIHLEDAVAGTWASNKLTRLQLTVMIPESGREAKMTLLERFYRQIGALVNLVVLDLRIATDEDERDEDEGYVTYKEKLFPGLLKLGNATKNGADRGGYLDLLAGLTRLEQLRGSFNVDPRGEGSVMGQEECEWVWEHWPRLQVADFYPSHFKHGARFGLYGSVEELETERLDLPACFKWLGKQAPDLTFMTAL